MYIIIAAILASFFAGAGVTYKYTSTKINQLEQGIEYANRESRRVLESAKAQVEFVEREQANKVAIIDANYMDSVATNHALANQLAAARLQSKYKSSGCNTMSKTSVTGVHKDTASTIDVSERLNQLIDTNAAIADANTLYAQKAHEWAMSIDKKMIMETAKK